MITSGTVLRFALVLAVLAISAHVWPGTVIPATEILILAILLSLFDWSANAVLGKSASAKSHSFTGWALAVIFLYTAGHLLPHVHMGIAAAFASGTVIWLVGRAFPAIFG